MSQTSAITPAQFTTFGDLLKFLRRRVGLSQSELSIAVGYSVSQISRLEKNQRAPDAAAIAARFVPELDLEKEPAWVARLLELAASHAEVEHPAEEDALPPRHAPQNILPTQFTSFVGREKEIAEITRLLTAKTPEAQKGRLVTLTGVGGAGKTRLALKLASDLLANFSDGVWWIDLAPLADPYLVPQRVASVLGLQEQASRPILVTLTDYLRDKNALLVMDNCEHLITASAHLAEHLIQHCPELSILATSREVLNIPVERSYAVPSLTTPDLQMSRSPEGLKQFEAVRLFVERAVAVNSKFVLTTDNASAILQICFCLDGIPLAIELAVAQLRLLSVEQIAARLDNRFRLLTGGSRTALPRHQTLQALIDWSYDLLTEPERILLRRLAVFAGGFTVEAVEKVCGGEGLEAGDIVGLLTQLLNKSLVVADYQEGQPSRYRLLETIRQYAEAKLNPTGEGDAVRRQHLEFYLALMGTENFFYSWYDLRIIMDIELDNLRAAAAWSQQIQVSAEIRLRLATALGVYGNMTGYWSEARTWLEGALAGTEATAPSWERANVTRVLADVLAALNEYPGAESQYLNCIRLYQALGRFLEAGWALGRLGNLARERGDPLSARRYMESSLAVTREYQDQDGTASNLVTLGEVFVLLEQTDRAAEVITEGIAISRSIGENGIINLAWGQNHLAHVAQLKGEFEQARELHEESLALFRHGRMQMGFAWAYQGLGETALGVGDAASAELHLKKALTLFHNMGDRAGVSWCLAGLAGVAVLNEEPQHAALLWGAAEQLRQSLGARPAPAARATHERLMALAREQLGEQEFNTGWAKGEATPLEEVITIISRLK